MSPAHVLALDQGTTSTRALVVDETGAVVGEARQRQATSHPRPGWVEQDPAELWSALESCAATALAAAGIRPGDLVGAGVTNQRETTLLWERATGKPLYPAIVWQDRRTAERCTELAEAGVGLLVEERTGLLLDPYFSATKLAWLLDNVPTARQRGEAGELCFGTVDSWIAWQASGGRRHVTEVTNASRTCLMDLARGRWDGELLERFGIPPALLPEIVQPGEALVGAGEASGWLAGKAVSLLGGLGDQQAALLAQGCVEPGLAKATFGTGTFVLAHCGAEVPERRHGLLATAAAGLGDRAQFALEGAVLSSGSAVSWLVDVGLLSEVDESEALARAGAADADLFFVPALAGLGTPRWDPRARGTLVGVTGGTSRPDVVRAVLEGLAQTTCDVLDAMAAAGHPVRLLRADGGAAANGWLMEQVCELAAVPVEVSAELESTALGAAYLAGLRAGLWSETDLAGLRRSDRTIVPPAGAQAARARRARRERWSEAVERAAGWARGAPG